MNQVERRNAIKEILFSDRNAQIQNLADRFGVMRQVRKEVQAGHQEWPVLLELQHLPDLRQGILPHEENPGGHSDGKHSCSDGNGRFR